MESPPSSGVWAHGVEHFADGLREADGDRAGDDAVADVQFNKVRNRKEEGEVAIVEAVSGVDPQAEIVRLTSGGNQAVQVAGAGRRIVEGLGEGAGVQFDELRSGRRRGLHLRGVGGDEQADVDAGVVEAAPRVAERGDLPGDVEPAFGGHLLAAFRDEADDIRAEANCDVADFGGVGHLEVQAGAHPGAQLPDIAILDVAAVLAQVGRDAMGSGLFAEAGGLDRIGFPKTTSAVAGFAERGDVIDVDTEFQHGDGVAGRGQRRLAGGPEVLF